ncbi:Trihelix transcription factor GTL1 [Bienertia sinuspersici]
MEGNGLTGRMYSNAGVGILGREMPLQTTPQPQNSQHHLQKHPNMMAFSQQQQQQQQQQHEQPTQLSVKQTSNYLSYNNPNSNPNQNPCLKTKTQITNSDEDEPGCTNDHENSSLDGKRKSSSNMSPWQRMKWTDNMVRLLIMAVYYIGDEVGNEVGSEKKKSGAGSGVGLLQKKGKWKSVSRAMMEKGFYVSPQQCEDKFNDLNKRYKRVNDILGKGTACKVVENQSLLDSMEITPKMKEEVRKLLNSKHLFFREMCAYHNSCGHAAAGHATSDGVTTAIEAHSQPHQQQQQQQQQQSCFHSTSISPSSMELSSSHKLGLGFDDHEDDDDADDEDDDDDFDDDEEDHDEGGGGGARKRAKTVASIPSNNSQALQQLNGEIMGMLQNGSKSSWEKKQWVTSQLVQLEEQGLKFQLRALELEKQRFKWLKFSSKKEREMEKMKIDNERKRLENERMMLLLRKKEIELVVDQQHHSNPSCISA